MKFLSVAFFFSFLTQNVFASEVNYRFNYSGIEGSTRVYLSCDYVEDRTEEILAKLGATEIDVRCSGGITSFGQFYPVFGDVSFKFPTNVPFDVKISSSDSWSTNCFFDTFFINGLSRKFKKNLIISKKNSFCFSSDDQYFYELQVQ